MLLCLRYLLKFGSVSQYVGYSALMDYFPVMEMKPNPSCSDKFCCERQKEWREKKKAKCEVTPPPPPEEVVHEDNQWGMLMSIGCLVWLCVCITCCLHCVSTHFQAFHWLTNPNQRRRLATLHCPVV